VTFVEPPEGAWQGVTVDRARFKVRRFERLQAVPADREMVHYLVVGGPEAALGAAAKLAAFKGPGRWVLPTEYVVYRFAPE